MYYNEEILSDSLKLLLDIRHDLTPVLAGTEYIKNTTKNNSSEQRLVKMGELTYKKTFELILKIEKNVEFLKKERKDA